MNTHDHCQELKSTRLAWLHPLRSSQNKNTHDWSREKMSLPELIEVKPACLQRVSRTLRKGSSGIYDEHLNQYFCDISRAATVCQTRSKIEKRRHLKINCVKRMTYLRPLVVKLTKLIIACYSHYFLLGVVPGTVIIIRCTVQITADTVLYHCTSPTNLRYPLLYNQFCWHDVYTMIINSLEEKMTLYAYQIQKR